MSEPAHRTILFPHWTIQGPLLLFASVVGLTWIRKGTIVVGSERKLPESHNRLSKWDLACIRRSPKRGFSVEHVRAEATVQTPGAPRHWAILPRIMKQGVATEVEIDIDTLDRRLDEERTSTNGTYVGNVKLGAWARKRD
jgi:hypothetical protein